VTLLTIAFKNLRGNMLRSLSLFLVMFVLSGTLLTITLLHTGLTLSLERSRQRLGADIMVVPSGHSGDARDVFLVGSTGSFTMPGGAAFPADVLRSYEGVDAATPQLFVVSAPLPCCSVSDTMIIGFDPETDFVIAPWVRERAGAGGRQGPHEALVGTDILAGVGGRLKLFGREFRIVGKLERTDLRYLDSGIFIPLECVRAMVRDSKQKARKTLAIGQDEISCLLIRMKETGNAERTALRLEHDYPDRKALVVSQLVRANAGALSVPLKGIAVLFSIQWAVSLFLIGVVHTFSIDGRRAELGIQKALGATDGNVRGMLLAEAALLSGVASLAGIGAGSLLVRAVAGHVRQAVDIPLQLPGGPSVVLIAAAVFVLSVASGILPSLYSALRTSRTEPFYLIRGDRQGKGGLP
jgi:putative ABC transport system permease protein